MEEERVVKSPDELVLGENENEGREITTENQVYEKAKVTTDTGVDITHINSDDDDLTDPDEDDQYQTPISQKTTSIFI